MLYPKLTIISFPLIYFIGIVWKSVYWPKQSIFWLFSTSTLKWWYEFCAALSSFFGTSNTCTSFHSSSSILFCHMCQNVEKLFSYNIYTPTHIQKRFHSNWWTCFFPLIQLCFPGELVIHCDSSERARFFFHTRSEYLVFISF